MERRNPVTIFFELVKFGDDEMKSNEQFYKDDLARVGKGGEGAGSANKSSC